MSRQPVGKRFHRLTLLTCIAVSAVSAAIGYAAGQWRSDGPGPNIGRVAATENKQAVQPRHHERTPVNFASPEFRRLKRDALRGSKDAALAVLRAYEECMPPDGIGAKPDPSFIAECDRSFKHWVAIAGVNGVGEAANLIFNDLSDSDRCEDIYRARFWTTRIPWWGPEQPWIGADAKLREKERRCGW